MQLKKVEITNLISFPNQDGRLRNNDQLLNVNGISLLSMTNGQAMETLRRAMIQNEGPNNAIILTVARRVSQRSCDNPSDHGESSGHDRSDSLLSESGDSFYVSNENLSFKCNSFSNENLAAFSNENKCNSYSIENLASFSNKCNAFSNENLEPFSDENKCNSYSNENLALKCNGVTPDTSTSDNSATTVIFRTGQLVDVRTDEDIAKCNNNSKTKGEVVQQRFVSDLIDLQEGMDYEALEKVKGNGSLGNHNKTFSNLTEVELYNSSASEPEKEAEARYCDMQSSFRETTKRKR